MNPERKKKIIYIFFNVKKNKNKRRPIKLLWMQLKTQ